MALLKLGRHESANADATVALSIDPTYTKAYLRRATARRELGDLEGAARDFEKVLELEPKNKQGRNSIDFRKTSQKGPKKVLLKSLKIVVSSSIKIYQNGLKKCAQQDLNSKISIELHPRPRTSSRRRG